MVSILPVQHGHHFEIHSVNSGNGGRDRQYGAPCRQLTRYRALTLLFEKRAGLEHGGEHVAERADHRGNPSDVISDIAKVWPNLGVDARQVVMLEAIGDMLHRPEHAFESRQLAPKIEDEIYLATAE